MGGIRLLSLFVRHGTGSHGRVEGAVSGVEEIHEIYRERFSAEVHSVVIDNALAPETPPVFEASHSVIAGDNHDSEFSGWDRGLAFARQSGLEYDVVHLCTSTFRSLYSEYTAFVDERVLQLIAAVPSCVGHIDAYNEPVELFGRPSQHWIRTSYFFLSRQVAEALSSFVSVKEPERLFCDSPNDVFKEDAPLSKNYREMLLSWLSGRDLGQGRIWHSAFPDLRQHLPEVRRKIVAILNEHLLAIRLREAGLPLLDGIWLGHNLRSVAFPIAVGGWNPDWRHQIMTRPVGAS
jgi:hypothetical protein